MGVAKQESPATRVYRSPRRAEQARRTRARILAAATRQFVARGYAATTMGSIAGAAGVSVPAVELIFGTKAKLLKAAIDVAIAGDDAPVPMFERQWAATAASTGDAASFLAVFARALREAAVRSAGLIVAAGDAARADRDIAALSRRLSRQRVITVTWIVDGLRERTALRAGVTRQMAIDVLWLLMEPVVFQRLTRERSWTPAQFERWFPDSASRLLLPGAGEAGATPGPKAGPVHEPMSAATTKEASPVAQVTVRYFVEDVEAAAAFYCDRLGFRVDLPRAPGFAGLARGELRLLLHEPGAGGAGIAGGTPAPGGWNRFQIAVADIGSTVSKLRSQGVRFRGGIIEGPAGHQILVEDPSGNPVEIFQPRTA
jgi:AcrR family transcriptional regulator/catechol 2,3-dioxygenase-like lactoylglutathione lyase family enzyme